MVSITSTALCPSESSLRYDKIKWSQPCSNKALIIKTGGQKDLVCNLLTPDKGEGDTCNVLKDPPLTDSEILLKGVILPWVPGTLPVSSHLGGGKWRSPDLVLISAYLDLKIYLIYYLNISINYDQIIQKSSDPFFT